MVNVKDLDIENLNLQPNDVVVIRYPEHLQSMFDDLLIICKQLRQLKGIIPLLLPDEIYIKKCSKKDLMLIKEDAQILLKAKKYTQTLLKGEKYNG